MSRNSLPILAALLGLAVLPAAPASAAEKDPYVVVLRDSVERVDAAIERRERARGFRAALRFEHAIKGFSARLTAAQVRALREDPQVAAVERDRMVRATAAVPLAAGEPLPPAGVRRIGAATATTVREAADVAVAVIDTGVDLSHPDLNAAAGTNCIAPGSAPADDNGHGTHVAGTIAARNDGAGVTGVAPGTKVYAVKVLDAEGSGSWSQVICGIDWVTANAAKLGIRVANMSLGGSGSDDGACGRRDGDALHRAICRAAEAGVLNVVAAGNDAVDAGGDAPASYDEVLTVTAMADRDGAGGATGGSFCGESDDRRATFSNYVTTTDDLAHTVAAPGVCIRSTMPGGSWASMSGTSMAAPHVAGAVALCVGEGGTDGPCAAMTPAETIEHVRTAAAERSVADSTWGFTGDPLRPLTGKSYGHLVDASYREPAETVPADEPADPVLEEPAAPVEEPAAPVEDPPAAEEPQPPAPPPAAPADQPAPPPAGDTVPPSAATPAISLDVRRRRLRAVVRRGLRIAVTCEPACTGPVRLRVSLGRRATQSRARRVAPGRTVTVRLSRAARRALARRGRARVTVHATAYGATPASKRVTIR